MYIYVAPLNFCVILLNVGKIVVVVVAAF